MIAALRRRRVTGVATSAILTVGAAVIALAAVLLFAMGRTPWGPSGSPGLWSGDPWSSQTSQRLADPFTFTHIIHGAVYYWLLWLVARKLPLGLRGVLAVALESAWEVFENTDMIIQRYRVATISLGYYGDSVLNSVGDMLTAALGFTLAARLPPRVTVIGCLLIEVILALRIRDSLFLNILMLIYPIDAVKHWQLGR